MKSIATNVIDFALREARASRLALYTFALYYDHESPAVSACLDSEENSAKVVARINSNNRQYFIPAAKSGDLKAASLWLANIGRNLSLGDFAMVNVGRTKVANAASAGTFVEMLQALLAKEDEIAALASNRSTLLICCSGPDDEVQYWWGVNAA
jgi:hypothetical protein